ncbi:hypothetical protein Vqi01_29830 [Micromonospora qiuiae]|uniref:Peptidase C39-like domain-containing protein n=1 Tax=Micromonospora qiuiae TaxID=502268 RepID=A0ABQ4JCC1_9ACTN|nr:C39 family peptidase [Micromonospora qiuiae]GIJ27821.1 hypothetical protein Vqi01_29830 [Micromonospora qiuiae]
MKHHVKRQLRRLAAERPYQIVAASAVALVLATGSGAVLAGTGNAPPTAQITTVAELRGDAAASRGEERVAPSPSTTPSGKAAPSATASPSRKATSAAPDPDVTSKKVAPKKPKKPKPPKKKVLNYAHQAQINGYFCGPAAVRNALSAGGVERDQDTLATQLRTTYAGTHSAEDTTRVLNAVVKGKPYQTRWIRGASATPAQMDQLQADVVAAVADGRGIVVNVAGSATDTNGRWHSFPGGHYVAVVGYEDEGRLVKIADSADASYPSYWMTTIDLANWAATRGYSA